MDASSNSHSALQIALTTMKERCHQLQQRLKNVEEENYSLKLKLLRDNKDSSSNLLSISEDHLKEQVCLLSKQKEELSGHIKMVATENQTLWERLSKLSEDNRHLDTSMFKIKQSLKHHDAKALDQKIESTIHKSMEEVSLKVMNGIIQEKTELEKQCKEMTDLQSDNLNIQDFCFSFPDDYSMMTDLNKHYEKLNQFKLSLVKQRKDLMNVLQCLKSQPVSVGNENEPAVQTQTPPVVHYSHSSTIEMTTEGDPTQNMICPMCRIVFLGCTTEFVDHVSNHFSDENDEFVSSTDFTEP